MCKHFKKIANLIFPMCEINKANKKIDIDIKDICNENFDFQYARGYETLTSDRLKEFLKETQELKKILEEKAKSSLIAITLSISLVLTLSKTLADIRNNMSVSSSIIAFLLGVMGVGYLVLAGLLSLYSLSEINQVATIYPDDLNSQEKDLNNTIASSIELNSKYNTKRNNLMSGSYKCIMNALICFFFLFIVLSIFPKPATDQAKIINIEKEQKQLINNIRKLEEQQKQDLIQKEYLDRTIMDINDKIINLEKSIINAEKKDTIIKEIDQIKQQQADINLRIDKERK